MCGLGGRLPSQRFKGLKVCRVWSVGLGGGLPRQRFKGFKLFKRLEGLEGLRAGKRQAWTPIRSHRWPWGRVAKSAF